MYLEIRVATPSEEPKVLSFLRKEGYHGPLGSNDRLIVALGEGEFAGVVRLAREEESLVLRGMRVRRDVRRRGIGRQLLAFAEVEIGRETCYCIPFTWLVPFYSAAGFRQIDAADTPEFLATS
jgi:N-acetylglutamate synthase-like GNAT family acetyltransferase